MLKTVNPFSTQNLTLSIIKWSTCRNTGSASCHWLFAQAAVEVGGLGLGAVITILATTVLAVVTGILLASLIAVLGLFVIPVQRRRAKSELRDKVAALREQLVQTLRRPLVPMVNSFRFLGNETSNSSVHGGRNPHNFKIAA